MREASAQRVRELVRLYAPTAAAGYFFQRINKNNEVLRYPSTGSYKLDPFEAPIGVPNGVYTVCYVKLLDDRRPMPAANVNHPYPEIPYYFPATVSDSPESADRASSEESQDGEGSAPAALVPKDERPQRSLRAELRAELERLPDVREARTEYMQRHLAIQLQEQQQDLHKYGHVVQEVGGGFALNRAYRLESQQAMETMMELAKRTAEDAQYMMSLFRGMQEMQGQALVELKKQISLLASPPPPPAPADYSGAATAVVNLVRDVGVALIQLKAGHAPGSLVASRNEDGLTADLRAKSHAVTGSLTPVAAESEGPVGADPPGARPVREETAATIGPELFLEELASQVAAPQKLQNAEQPVESELSSVEQDELTEQLSALATEFLNREAQEQAGRVRKGVDPALPLPLVAPPTVTPVASPLKEAAPPAVVVPAVQPVLDTDSSGELHKQAEQLLAAVGSIDQLQAMLAAGDLGRLQRLIASLPRKGMKT